MRLILHILLFAPLYLLSKIDGTLAYERAIVVDLESWKTKRDIVDADINVCSELVKGILTSTVLSSSLSWDDGYNQVPLVGQFMDVFIRNESSPFLYCVFINDGRHVLVMGITEDEDNRFVADHLSTRVYDLPELSSFARKWLKDNSLLDYKDNYKRTYVLEEESLDFNQ
jgi:hypothetical protein